MSSQKGHTKIRSISGAKSNLSVLSFVDQLQVSDHSKRESRNRETFLPPLSVFRWWARRTGAINEAILTGSTQVFGDRRLNVLDPFAGGGTIPLVALRAGHRVHAQDLNPWSVAGMQVMFDLPSDEKLAQAYRDLYDLAAPLIEHAYGTKMNDGSRGQLLHTFRVATGCCQNCGIQQRIFPYSLLTLLERKERGRPEAVLACPLGHVFFGRVDGNPHCSTCESAVDPEAIYIPRRIVTCNSCKQPQRLSEIATSPGWKWEVVLVERGNGKNREFDFPTKQELRKCNRKWDFKFDLGDIPRGQETSVLLNHGFRKWNDLFPDRQGYVTQSLLEMAPLVSGDEKVVNCLRMAIIGTSEFAGHLCRWDRFYLKCNDATAGHRFNFSTFVPELNVWGLNLIGRGTTSRRIKSMMKASSWMDNNIPGREYLDIEKSHLRREGELPDLRIVAGDSANLDSVPDGIFDLVLTDPPYHDDVQYGELSLLFRTWAGLNSKKLRGEAVSNLTSGMNTTSSQYSDTLKAIFSECHVKLSVDGRLIFSYANHEPRAWLALFEALQASGYSAISCLLLHSENETDFKKRNVDSCNEDLIMELSASPRRRIGVVLGDEINNSFMTEVTALFVQVGHLKTNWQDQALQALVDAKGPLKT